MEASGIRRKVDDLGRVVLPVGMRRALGIGEGEEVEVWLDGDRVVVAKPAEHCAFCGGQEELRGFRGRVVCWSCLAALRALARDGGEVTGEPVAAAPGREQSLLGDDDARSEDEV
jgi:transcriptional pleiotropic regulator of transition state genes